MVANRTEPEPFRVLLENLFEEQPVAVEEESVADYNDDTVLLVDNETGTVIETSPLAALEDAILLVNSDLFMTGTIDLDATSVPDVIDGLADHRFSLRGYPASNKEKLLLILISRRIEQMAYEHGSGTLRSSFQRLSRIADEKGTQRVYERVGELDVDVHVYGVPNWTPSSEFPVTMHGGYTDDFKQSWFVVFTPPPGVDAEGAALLAIEQESGTWDGFWTYQQSLVDDIAEYIRHNL